MVKLRDLDWRVPEPGLYQLPATCPRSGRVRVTETTGAGKDRIVWLEWDARQGKTFIYDRGPMHYSEWLKMMGMA